MEQKRVVIVEDHGKMRDLLTEIVEKDDDLDGSWNCPEWDRGLRADSTAGAGCCPAGSDYAGYGRTGRAGRDESL